MAQTLIESIFENQNRLDNTALAGDYSLANTDLSGLYGLRNTGLQNQGANYRNDQSLAVQKLLGLLGNQSTVRGQDIDLTKAKAAAEAQKEVARIQRESALGTAGIGAGASNFAATAGLQGALGVGGLNLEGTRLSADAKRYGDLLQAVAQKQATEAAARTADLTSGRGLQGTLGSAALGARAQSDAARYGMQGQIGAAEIAARAPEISARSKAGLIEALSPSIKSLIESFVGAGLPPQQAVAAAKIAAPAMSAPARRRPSANYPTVTIANIPGFAAGRIPKGSLMGNDQTAARARVLAQARAQPIAPVYGSGRV